MSNLKPEDNNINNINNINNDINNFNINNLPSSFETTNVDIYQHQQKDSMAPITNSPEKYNESKKEEKIESTMMTQVPFMNELDNKEPIYELNKSLEKTDVTSKNSSSKEDPPLQKSESFYQKTKRWAGTVWSYVNIANYFPKTEYKEYRNCNGDMVRIPVKKIPLKKKKVEETDEEHIVNKVVDNNRINLAGFTGDRIPIPTFPY